MTTNFKLKKGASARKAMKMAEVLQRLFGPTVMSFERGHWQIQCRVPAIELRLIMITLILSDVADVEPL